MKPEKVIGRTLSLLLLLALFFYMQASPLSSMQYFPVSSNSQA
jgi:hypothetical protein